MGAQTYAKCQSMCSVCISVCLSLRAIELFESSGRRVLESSSVYLLGESASPFIGEGDGLTSQRERERECIHVLPSLVAHAVGYEMVASAHNTVYAKTRLADSTVFA